MYCISPELPGRFCAGCRGHFISLINIIHCRYYQNGVSFKCFCIAKRVAFFYGLLVTFAHQSYFQAPQFTSPLRLISYTWDIIRVVNTLYVSMSRSALYFSMASWWFSHTSATVKHIVHFTSLMDVVHFRYYQSGEYFIRFHLPIVYWWFSRNTAIFKHHSSLPFLINIIHFRYYQIGQYFTCSHIMYCVLFPHILMVTFTHHSSRDYSGHYPSLECYQSGQYLICFYIIESLLVIHTCVVTFSITVYSIPLITIVHFKFYQSGQYFTYSYITESILFPHSNLVIFNTSAYFIIVINSFFLNTIRVISNSKYLTSQ